MTNRPWSMLDEVASRLSTPAELPPEILTVVADRLEEAVSASDSAELANIRDGLARLFSDLVRKADDGAIAAVRGTSSASGTAMSAFMLGQVGFAQQFAAQASERRADEPFFAALRAQAYAGHLKALLEGDLSNMELAEAVSERSETTSRKLRVLGELGIVDHRRDGTSRRNFLTPAARAAIEAEQAAKAALASMPRRESVQRLLQNRRTQLPEHLRQRLSLAPSGLFGAMATN